MRKIALFSFNGEPMCFAHVLLNALDLESRGHEATIVIEGSSTKLVGVFGEDPDLPFAARYAEAREAGLIGGVCRACAAKTGSLDAARQQGLTLLDGMSGHPAVGDYLERGYEVLTF